MKKIGLLFIVLFLGCTSNKELLRRIEILEAKIQKYESVSIDSADEIIYLDSMTEIDMYGMEIVEKKFCPECKRQGLESIVQRGMISRTLMNTIEYWDENGIYHYEDPNITTIEWYCNQGHQWATKE